MIMVVKPSLQEYEVVLSRLSNTIWQREWAEGDLRNSRRVEVADSSAIFFHSDSSETVTKF